MQTELVRVRRFSSMDAGFVKSFVNSLVSLVRRFSSMDAGFVKSFVNSLVSLVRRFSSMDAGFVKTRRRFLPFNNNQRL